MMIADFTSIVLIWFLPLTVGGAVTSGQRNDLANGTMAQVTREQFGHGQLTTQETSISNPATETAAIDVTTSTWDVADSPEGTNGSGSLPKTTPALPPVTSTLKTRSAVNGSAGTVQVGTEPVTFTTEVPPVNATDPTGPSSVPPVPSNSTQTGDTGHMSTTELGREKSTSSSTSQSRLTTLISTATASVKADDGRSTSTESVTGVNTLNGSMGSRTTSAGKTVSHLTNAKKPRNAKTRSNDGKAVAGIIGGALALMMVGFLAIYIKKRKLQKQQITTTDWAGPTPFLMAGNDNGQVSLRSSNRISLASFLPQRLSKRLSLLPECDEELQDMTVGVTFGGKTQGDASVEVSKEPSGTIPTVTATEKAAEKVEKSALETPLEINNIPSTNNSHAGNQTQDNSGNPSNALGKQGKQEKEEEKQ
ncbi:uncharacterized protein evi2b [Menidia menidia]